MTLFDVSKCRFIFVTHCPFKIYLGNCQDFSVHSEIKSFLQIFYIAITDTIW